ncbi:MAG: HNH endonuclease [Gammaproteobacteria bacterium]|nr:HNH endonuclease [Gammaproteobacteria bacterium]
MCESCLKAGRYTAGNECDHITAKALGGDDSPSNLQWLCKPCHAAKTARESTGGDIPQGCDASGVPVDPAHHWGRAGRELGDGRK